MGDVLALIRGLVPDYRHGVRAQTGNAVAVAGIILIGRWVGKERAGVGAARVDDHLLEHLACWCGNRATAGADGQVRPV
jgi:hypothetical protein